MSVFDIVEELLSVLPVLLEEPGEPDAPMAALLLLLDPLCVLSAVLPALGEVELLVLGEVLLLALGELLLVSVLELELPEVWAMARPTPPARAAAVARVVRVFFAFISVLLDMRSPAAKENHRRDRLGRKTPAAASWFSA